MQADYSSISPEASQKGLSGAQWVLLESVAHKILLSDSSWAVEFKRLSVGRIYTWVGISPPPFRDSRSRGSPALFPLKRVTSVCVGRGGLEQPRFTTFCKICHFLHPIGVKWAEGSPGALWCPVLWGRLVWLGDLAMDTKPHPRSAKGSVNFIFCSFFFLTNIC
jgi:hypothetical protein